MIKNLNLKINKEIEKNNCGWDFSFVGWYLVGTYFYFTDFEKNILLSLWEIALSPRRSTPGKSKRISL